MSAAIGRYDGTRRFVPVPVCGSFAPFPGFLETSMAIDNQVMARVAHLARLQIDDSEAAALSGRLNEILAMVDQLQQADVDDVAPLAHPLEANQPLRADEVTEPDVRDRTLPLAPASEDGCFLVPRVIE